MKKIDKILSYAIDSARNIPVRKSVSGKTMQRVYAICLDDKDRIISESSNTYTKSHPYQHQCACSVGKDGAIYPHAEIMAIIKARKQSVSRIVVARVGNSGNPLPAVPCIICQYAIMENEINSIITT